MEFTNIINQMKKEQAERISDIEKRIQAFKSYRTKCWAIPENVNAHQERIMINSFKNEFGIPLSFYGSAFECDPDNFDRWAKKFIKECIRHVTTGRPNNQLMILLDCDLDLDFSWFLIGIPYRELNQDQRKAFSIMAFGCDDEDELSGYAMDVCEQIANPPIEAEPEALTPEPTADLF